MTVVLRYIDRRVVRDATALIVLLLVSGQASVVPAQGPPNFIVTFRDGTAPASRAASVGNAGGTLRATYANVTAAAVTLPSQAAVAALQRDPSVLGIIPDRPVFAFQRANKRPDKPGGGKGGGGGNGGEVIPSGVARVRQSSSSIDGSYLLNGSNQGVAILDTGIDFTHADLMPEPDGPLTAFSAFGPSCQDDNGHGTHGAGIVAAVDNDLDVIGVAPAAALYCVKVLDGAGVGSDSTIMLGLEWVIDANLAGVSPPITVVNMSLGRPGTLDDNLLLRDLVAQLWDAGVVVVVAAGNNPGSEVSQQVPATYPEVIAVASMTALPGVNQCRRVNFIVEADTASYFTTDGAFVGGIGVTVSAPGEKLENINKGCRLTSEGILSTQLGGGTTRKSGTSMAAPHVAGIVALMIENGDGEDGDHSFVENIRSHLRANAVGEGVAPLDSPSAAYSDDGEKEGVAQAP